MMETQRLLQQGPSDAERALLESARADGPPAGAKERALVALAGLTAGGGAPAGGPDASLASAGGHVAAPALELGALAKLGLAVVVGVGLVGAGAAVHLYGQRKAPVDAMDSHAPSSRLASAPGTAATPPAAEPGIPSPSEEVMAPSPTEPAPRPAAAAADESLGAELRLLDQARAAVDARNPAAAQRLLDAYARRFPEGRLRPEASVLRLTVMVRQGKRAEAKALATRLLASDPTRAYEPRIRSLLREAGE
jgi:TolA-binding protein